MITDISYIIGFRADTAERTKALFFVLRKLRGDFPGLEIIVVEHDAEKLMNFEKALKINHVFHQTGGHFNRPEAFNIGVRHSNKNAFVFADFDMSFEEEDFLTCVKALKNFEAVLPNKSQYLKFFTQTGFEKIGGWDERFTGWSGGEQRAMNHLIFQKLTSKSFNFKNCDFDHFSSIPDEHNESDTNRDLFQIIETYHGKTLDRYIHFLKNQNEVSETVVRAKPRTEAGSSNLALPFSASLELRGELQKNELNFILAVTTYNRFDYLKNLLDSFFETRNPKINWQIIIADDGSTDGTLVYLENLKKQHPITIIRNRQVDIIRQTNTILKKLSETDFDFCFKCDGDVVFKKTGWDLKFWQIARKTGYHHLIFYDKNWRPHVNFDQPIRYGDLVSNCPPENIQGAFFTLTPEIIKNVGFFDEQQFGRRGFGHIDYSFRCCRSGFNLLTSPFDLADSNDFIGLQGANNYVTTASSKYKSLFNPKKVIEKKKKLIQLPRTFVPYNENYFSLDEFLKANQQPLKNDKTPETNRYPKADAKFYPERGISGFIGFIIKRFYNLCIDLRLYSIPKGIKFLGRVLNKISINLIDIEK